MKRLLVLAAVAGTGVAGCVAPAAPWPDRPWIDSGCESVGHCRVRGKLKIIRGVPYSGGALTLDDGRCLPLALPPEIVRQHSRWDDRRVAVEGQALERAPESVGIVSVEYVDRFVPTRLCPTGPLTIYVQRLSLKAGE